MLRNTNFFSLFFRIIVITSPSELRNLMLNLRFVRSHEGSPDADHTSRKT